MKRYRIEKKVGRDDVLLGIYDGETVTHALAAMYRDTGHPSVTVGADGELANMPHWLYYRDNLTVIERPLHYLAGS